MLTTGLHLCGGQGVLVVCLKIKQRYPLKEGLQTSETGVFAFLLHPDPSVWPELLLSSLSATQTELNC